MKKVISIFLFLAISGCAYVQPLVHDFNVVSVPQEIQIGQQAQQEVFKQMTIVQDPAINAKINNLGQRLVQALPRKDFSYEFYVVNDKSPNAFTIPGGKIFVHTGLLQFAQDDQELAGVIAHEIGHAYERHPAKSISRQYGVETLSQLLFKGNTVAKSQMKAIAVQIAKGSFLTYYGREEEYQADEAGFYILRRSGIPSAGLLRFFERLQTLQGGGAQLAFLSTHPPTPERINRLKALEAGQRAPGIQSRSLMPS